MSSSWGEGESVVCVCRKTPVAGCSLSVPAPVPSRSPDWPGTQGQGVITDLRPRESGTKALGAGGCLLLAHQVHTWRGRDEEAEISPRTSKNKGRCLLQAWSEPWEETLAIHLGILLSDQGQESI